MPEMIQIEGDMVRVMRTDMIREVRLQDFLPQIEHRPPVTLGLLPKSAIFIHWDESDPKNKRAQMLCELAPGVRTQSFLGKQIPLSVPWTYFLFDFMTAGDPMEGKAWMHNNTRVYWARQQVTGIDSILRTALVYNCDTHGAICFGTTGVDVSKPLGVRVDQTVDEFYRTQFTHTNHAGSPWQTETGKDTVDRWAAETKKDPAAFLNFPEWEADIKAFKPGVGGMRSWTVKELMGSLHDRSQPIEVEGRIPQMIMPMTFGRVEEWLGDIEPAYLLRLETALANVRAEHPEKFVATAVAPAD